MSGGPGGGAGPGAAPQVVDVLLCEILGVPAAVTWSPGLRGAAASRLCWWR